MKKALMPFVALLSLIVTSVVFAHPGGHGQLGSFESATDTITLPVTIGLDGTVVWGLGHSHSHALQFSPLISAGSLHQNKIVQLQDGTVVRFRSRAKDIGGGFAALPPVEFGLDFGIEVGLSYSRGSYRASLQSASNHEELFNRAPLKIPTNLTELEDWNHGDQLAMATNGTVMFTAGIHTLPVEIAAATYATGGWMLNLTKSSDTEIIVLLRRDRSRGMNVSLGNIFVELGRTISTDFDQAFSFKFDLTQSQALAAYHQALRGNWLVAQKLWSENVQGVTHLSRVEGTTQSRVSFTRYGIPIMIRWGRTQTSDLRQEERHEYTEEDEDLHESEQSILASHQFTKTTVKWSHTIARLDTLISGGVLKHPGEDKHYYATFKWFRERNYMSKVGFRNFLYMVANRTGFEQLKSYSEVEPRPGYGRATVDLNITEKGFERLLNLSPRSPQLAGRSLFQKLLNNFQTSVQKNQDRQIALTLKKLGLYVMGHSQRMKLLVQILGQEGHVLRLGMKGEHFSPIYATF